MSQGYANLEKQVLAILEKKSPAAPVSVPFSVAAELARETLTNPPDSIQLQNYALFNQFTGGFRLNEFSIICGATGTGKSQLLANLSAQMTVGGTPHYVASVETGSEDFARRCISIVSEKDWNTGKQFNQSEVDDVYDVHGKFIYKDMARLAPYENRVSPMRLMCDLLHHNQEYGTKVALLDNLNFFMDVGTGDNERVLMDRTIHDFVIFTKHVPMHIILIMHPKKTESGRVESEFDIKGSSTAVQEASNVFLWNRVDQKRDGHQLPAVCPVQNLRELKIAKMRRLGRNVGTRILISSPDGNILNEEKTL